MLVFPRLPDFYLGRRKVSFRLFANSRISIICKVDFFSIRYVLIYFLFFIPPTPEGVAGAREASPVATTRFYYSRLFSGIVIVFSPNFDYSRKTEYLYSNSNNRGNTTTTYSWLNQKHFLLLMRTIYSNIQTFLACLKHYSTLAFSILLSSVYYFPIIESETPLLPGLSVGQSQFLKSQLSFTSNAPSGELVFPFHVLCFMCAV